MTHQQIVLSTLRKFRGGLSDYGIFHASKATQHKMTPSSARTRRAELVAQGLVKQHPTKTELSSTGRKAKVWVVA
jgi:ribosomal protein S19E (S16A)